MASFSSQTALSTASRPAFSVLALCLMEPEPTSSLELSQVFAGVDGAASGEMAFARSLGTRGAAPGQLKGPSPVPIPNSRLHTLADSDSELTNYLSATDGLATLRGLLVVSDPGNRRIQVLTKHGAPLQVLPLGPPPLWMFTAASDQPIKTSLDLVAGRQRVYLAGQCEHSVHVIAAC